jgi:hypothetical protein
MRFFSLSAFQNASGSILTNPALTFPIPREENDPGTVSVILDAVSGFFPCP